MRDSHALVWGSLERFDPPQLDFLASSLGRGGLAPSLHSSRTSLAFDPMCYPKKIISGGITSNKYFCSKL